jgi:hypothetical protein
MLCCCWDWLRYVTRQTRVTTDPDTKLAKGLWGDSSLSSSTWAHVKGIQGILKQLGGINAIRDPMLRESVIL